MALLFFQNKNDLYKNIDNFCKSLYNTTIIKNNIKNQKDKILWLN